MAQKRFKAICIVFVVALACLGARGAAAQDTTGKVLRVAVKPIAPFVFGHGTDLSGFSIDLWNARRAVAQGRDDVGGRHDGR